MAAINYRPKARALVLQILYELDCTDHAIELVLAERLETEEAPAALRALVHKLLEGVRENMTQLDTLIHRYAPEWPLEQIAIIDRNILRIAAYEVTQDPSVPVGVAINEAIELAKTYGSESTPRFVNGVLGTLAAREEGQQPTTNKQV